MSEECPDCGKDPCTDSCKDDKFLLTRVKNVKADTDPCTESEAKDCPLTQPFYDQLTQDFVLIGVGIVGSLFVCNPDVYANGQWLRLEGGTKVQITGIEDTYLLVKNACPDGAAIETNKEPGDIFAKGQNIWIDSPPACGLLDGLCTTLLDCLRTEEGICFSSVPTVLADEKVHLFGGTLTDACEDDEGDGIVGSCFRKIKSIFSINGSLCYPEIPETNGNKDGENQKQFGVFRTGGSCDDGNANCFEKLEIGTDGIYKVCDGDIKFINNARVPILIERKELLNETISSGQVSGFARTLVLPDLPEECGNGICVVIEGQAYGITLTSADLFKFEFLANGQEFLLMAGNEQVNANGVSFPAHQNGTTIVCGVTDSVDITTNVENGMQSGEVEIKIWASMYYI